MLYTSFKLIVKHKCNKSVATNFHVYLLPEFRRKQAEGKAEQINYKNFKLIIKIQSIYKWLCTNVYNFI